MARGVCVDFPRSRACWIIACSPAAISLFANSVAVACNAPQRPMQQIELMFGRNVAGHVRVGEAAWSRFVAREITPRFPDGLTVIDATMPVEAQQAQVRKIVQSHLDQAKELRIQP